MIAAAVCTGFAAHREVSHIQDEQDRVRAGRIHSALADYYDEAGDWDGLQDFVNRIGFQSEREIVVLDADGVVVADNRPLRRRHDDRGHRVLFNAGIPRGPLPPPQYFTPIHVGRLRGGSRRHRRRSSRRPGLYFPRLTPGRTL